MTLISMIRRWLLTELIHTETVFSGISSMIFPKVWVVTASLCRAMKTAAMTLIPSLKLTGNLLNPGSPIRIPAIPSKSGKTPLNITYTFPQVLIPPALDDNNFDGTDDWIDDRGDRFESKTGYLHDAFMPGNGEDYPGYPAVPFKDDIYGTVNSGWYNGADNTYGDDFFEKLGKTHFRIHANYEGRGREGSLDISKGGILVVEEIFGGSPWVIFSHVLSSFARGTDITVESEALPSMVRYGTDTVFIRHHIMDENEPHRFDGQFDPYHLSYGYGEASVTTLVGGKDPCSLIEPAISMSSIMDPSTDQKTVTLIPDPDAYHTRTGRISKNRHGYLCGSQN